MNAMRTFRPLVAALLLVAGASAATAASPKPAPAAPGSATTQANPSAKPAGLPDFDSLDGDRNGIVTLPEIDVYSRPLSTRIQHCDTDKSPGLTRSEYANCTPKEHPGVAQHALPRQPAHTAPHGAAKEPAHKAPHDAAREPANKAPHGASKEPAHDATPAGRS